MAGLAGPDRTGPDRARADPAPPATVGTDKVGTDKVGTEEESMGHGADCRAAVNTRCWFPPLRPLPLG